MFNIIESKDFKFREFYDHELEWIKDKNYDLSLVVGHKEKWGNIAYLGLENDSLDLVYLEEDPDVNEGELVASIANYYFNVLDKEALFWQGEKIEREDFNQERKIKKFYFYNGSIDEGSFECLIEVSDQGANLEIKNMDFEKLEDLEDVKKIKNKILSREEFLKLEKELLEEINPVSWDLYYAGDLYVGGDVLLKGCAYDGGNWELTIDYQDGSRDIRRGKIDYPHNFEEFENLLFDLYKN